MVPPGLRGGLVRNGRKRGLHLHGLFAESLWSRTDGRRRDDCGGSDRGECGVVVDDLSVQQPALDVCLLVSRFNRLQDNRSMFTTAAPRASAGQLAIINAQHHSQSM